MKFHSDGIKPKIFKTIVKTMIIFVVILVLCLGLTLVNKNKLVRGLKIADIAVGGLTIEKARLKIKNPIEDFLKKEIILRYDNKTWTALPEKLGIKIDIDSTLNQASKIGHNKNFILGSAQKVLAFLGYYNLRVSYSINELDFEKFIREKLNDIDNPAKNADFIYDKNKNDFVLTHSQEGKIIDREKFKLQLYEKTGKLSKNDVYLVVIDDYPEVLDNETSKAYLEAKEILSRAPYKLIVNDPKKLIPSQNTLSKNELLALIEFRPITDKTNPANKILGVNFNLQNLKNYLTTLGSSIDRSPVNAQLIIQDNRVTNFSLPQDGLKLEIEKNIGKIRDEIINKSAGEIELEVSITPPKITTNKDINNFGINSLLARGVSNFSGSPANRIHNIKIGAAIFNGILLKPNEEFSFLSLLGEVGPEQGYKPELVIQKNKTVPEYGGGLCQVSTTAFRAAVYAGFPVRERTAHAFPVKYYNPQGFDATIYPPHPDLRFINDTPTYILIQTKIKGTELIFEFYGTDDGRKVELEGPIQYDIKDDGSMKARLIRRIFDKDGNFIRESIFNSNYKSPDLYPVERNPLE